MQVRGRIPGRHNVAVHLRGQLKHTHGELLGLSIASGSTEKICEARCNDNGQQRPRTGIPDGTNSIGCSSERTQKARLAAQARGRGSDGIQ